MNNNENEDNLNKEEEKTYEQLQHEVEELNDKMLRLMAENQNMRKRYEKQLEDIKEFSVANFAKDLMAVADNLDRAIIFEPENPSDDTKNILDGVKLTFKELNSVFNKYSIDEITPNAGEKFDYNFHHAISQISSDEYEADTIVGVMQKGYKIKDRLLRPAAVSVAKTK